MDVLEALITRRSIRQYSNGKVNKEIIRELIKYGSMPLRHVINNPGILW